jgi:hypothetical protein
MRWSVAMDPVTAMRTIGEASRRYSPVRLGYSRVRVYVRIMTELAELDPLATMIDDAHHVRLPRLPRPRTIDLTVPSPRQEIVIPEATITMLESYELYVD